MEKNLSMKYKEKNLMTMFTTRSLVQMKFLQSVRTDSTAKMRFQFFHSHFLLPTKSFNLKIEKQGTLYCSLRALLKCHFEPKQQRNAWMTSAIYTLEIQRLSKFCNENYPDEVFDLGQNQSLSFKPGGFRIWTVCESERSAKVNGLLKWTVR